LQETRCSSHETHGLYNDNKPLNKPTLWAGNWQRAPSINIRATTMRKNSVDASADAALARMGYKSELPRSLSMMSIMGL